MESAFILEINKGKEEKLKYGKEYLVHIKSENREKFFVGVWNKKMEKFIEKTQTWDPLLSHARKQVYTLKAMTLDNIKG